MDKELNANYPISLGFRYGPFLGIVLVVIYAFINENRWAVSAGTWTIVIPALLLVTMLVVGLRLRMLYSSITYTDMLKGTFTTGIVGVTVYIILFTLLNSSLSDFGATYKMWYIDNNVSALKMMGKSATEIEAAVVDIEKGYSLTFFDMLKLLMRMYFVAFILAALLSMGLFRMRTTAE